MNIIERLSPNQNARPDGTVPDLIVLHGTAGTDEGDLSWLAQSRAQASYHYLVMRSGIVHRLVADERRAWHAGVSTWQGRAGCNDYSIGIGMSNRGNGETYTAEQYAALGELLALLVRRWGIDPARIVGHYHVSPGRKTDPWYTFDWARALAEMYARLQQPPGET